MVHTPTPISSLDKPSKWPSANARLLGLGAGLPVQPLDRLANFSADEFERFALEWANGYSLLPRKWKTAPKVHRVGLTLDDRQTARRGAAVDWRSG